jgi:hypothetical protein
VAQPTGACDRGLSQDARLRRQTLARVQSHADPSESRSGAGVRIFITESPKQQPDPGRSGAFRSLSPQPLAFVLRSGIEGSAVNPLREETARARAIAQESFAKMVSAAVPGRCPWHYELR